MKNFSSPPRRGQGWVFPCSLLLLLLALSGCAVTAITWQRSIETRARTVMRDNSGVSDYWRYLESAFLALADGGRAENLSPDDIERSLLPVEQFTSGQHGGRSALESRMAFKQIFAGYRERYAADDPDANRAALKTLSSAIHQALL